MQPMNDTVRDRLYTRCAQAVTAAGAEAESLFLARLALLLFEHIGDEAPCLAAIDAALHQLPAPSLSARVASAGAPSIRHSQSD
jgi:hypothetical protein